MPDKAPTISEVVETACRNVDPKYDIDVARGRAFNKSLWSIIARMPRDQAIRYIAKNLKRYGKK